MRTTRTLTKPPERYWLVSQSETGLEVPLTPRSVAAPLEAAGWVAQPLFAAREIEAHLEEEDPDRIRTIAAVIDSLAGTDVVLEETRYLHDLAARLDRLTRLLVGDGEG